MEDTHKAMVNVLGDSKQVCRDLVSVICFS